ncbi:hypothetical protein NQ176_g5983 [Zarea fungicola]|uniref:Uncharacterized protein n=1 Tax=Zarea fungicola TaxID=93591 RepID=A0ACC1N7I1_9HYPO|nr:hypothetical protein NQ176_g5983 [Lecanicillium fungicola]
MKFAIAVVAFATSVLAGPFIGTNCGNNYGQELCCDTGAGNQNAVVGVCNDRHVWATRQVCGGRFCCVNKPNGSAYCKC